MLLHLFINIIINNNNKYCKYFNFRKQNSQKMNNLVYIFGKMSYKSIFILVIISDILVKVY